MMRALFVNLFVFFSNRFVYSEIFRKFATKYDYKTEDMDEKVVMKQELSEEELNQIAGGGKDTDPRKCIHDTHETAPCQCVRAAP